MPQLKLASQRMNVGGKTGGISPTLINGSAGASLRAPQVNVNARDVKYSNMAPNSIIPNMAIQQAAEAGMKLTQAAFKFSERQAKADADQAVLYYDNTMSDSFYGTVDSDGNIREGYGATRSGAAVDGASGYTGGVDAGYSNALEGLSPSARAMAMGRMGAIRNQSLYRGAKHQAAQQTILEQDQFAGEVMSLKKDISNNPLEAWRNTNKINGQLAKIPTAEGKDKYLKDIAQFTLSDSYNRRWEETGDPILSYNAAKDAVSQMESSGILGAENSDIIRGRLNRMKTSSEKQKRADAKKDLRQIQDAVTFQSPTNIDAGIRSGDEDKLYGAVAMIRDAYSGDPAEASKQVVAGVVAGVSRYVNGQGIPGAGGKIRAAKDVYASMRESGRFTRDELISLDQAILVGMEKDLNDAQDDKDVAGTTQLARDIARKRANGVPIALTPPQPGTNPKGEATQKAMELTAMEEQKDVIDAKKQMARTDYKAVLESKSRTGDLSKADIVVAGELVNQGVISSDEYLLTVEKVSEVKGRTGKKFPYQTDLNPTYKQGTALLKHQDTNRGLQKGLEKPESVGRNTSESEAEELLAYKTAKDTAYRKAVLAWDEASRAAYEKGVELDPNAWVGRYLKDEVYGGDSSGGFWRGMKGWGRTVFKLSTGIEL